MILQMIRRLAAFERAPGSVDLTEEAIRRDAFGDRPHVEVLIAEADGRCVGLAVVYAAYSSWSGAPALMIHDLFVEDGARRSGVGRTLIAAAAKVAEVRGCCRMDVNVLNWNKGARVFYSSLGFNQLSGWLPYRLDRQGIALLAADG
jgi:GNAT superfamily N-acetyltransferase